MDNAEIPEGEALPEKKKWEKKYKFSKPKNSRGENRVISERVPVRTIAATRRMNDKTVNTEVFFIQHVPVEMKREFKAACAYKGTSMTRELFRLMRVVIQEVDALREEERKKWLADQLEKERIEAEKAARIRARR